jgi:hypothetical protein
MIICTAVLSMAGGVSMLTFTKAFGTIFLGEPRTEYIHRPQEVAWAMRLPLYLNIAVLFLIGLFPVKVLAPLLTIIQSAGVDVNTLSLSGITGAMTWVGRASLIFIALIAILFGIRSLLFHGKKVSKEPTWGCGYVAPTPSLQYTGKSFSKSLAKLFGFITIENKKYRELGSASVFPAPRTYASIYLEFFETRIMDPLIKQFLRIFNFFSFIHNGKIQFYVLYGLLFMVILIILSVINVL